MFSSWPRRFFACHSPAPDCRLTDEGDRLIPLSIPWHPVGPNKYWLNIVTLRFLSLFPSGWLKMFTLLEKGGRNKIQGDGWEFCVVIDTFD